MADPCVESTASALCNDLFPLCGLRGGGNDALHITFHDRWGRDEVGGHSSASAVPAVGLISKHLVNSRCQPRTRFVFQGYDMIKAHA